MSPYKARIYMAYHMSEEGFMCTVFINIITNVRRV